MKYFLGSLLIASSFALTAPLYGQESESVTCADRMARSLGQGDFVKKRYSIDGSWSMVSDCTGTSLAFDESFRTKGGPDLKVYLSTLSLSELESGEVESTSHKLGVLKSNRGGQSYIIPPDVNLSEYKSIVIHCEAYSVLWGGFDL